MKKMLTILLIGILVLMAIPVSAATVGTVIGTAYNTDIVAYINHYAIPSFAVNGTSVIVAEDLKNFGFDVTWENSTRTLTIVRNSQTVPTEMEFTKAGASGSKYTDILATDISVYANAGSEVKKLTSYAMNGYTMIPLEELALFGECGWVEGERAVKLWIDGLRVRTSRQIVSTTSPATVSSSNVSTALTFLPEPCGYFEENSVNGITVHWGAKNTSGKVINYYTINYTYFNAVGDYAYDEITHKCTKSVKTVGPVPIGQNIISGGLIGYVPVCNTVRIDSIDLIYADGTTESVWCGQTVKEENKYSITERISILDKILGR